MSPDPARADLTFIVRVSRDRAGRLRGIVERARTGEKWRFEDSQAIGRLVERMVAGRSGAGGGGRRKRTMS
ncbi:MAG: hypothetical protein ACRELW_03110 [Candidatus Rokuibacteriota bacterium]